MRYSIYYIKIQFFSQSFRCRPPRATDELNEILTCFMYKNECFIRVDFYNVSATIEIHSPEDVPVYDAAVMQFNPSDDISISYKVTETL